MQIKKNMWYNIRPESVKKWYCSTKTPRLFIDKIIECIYLCPHIEDKMNKITTITTQFESELPYYQINHIYLHHPVIYKTKEIHIIILIHYHLIFG
jgi:hypothetical protein